MGRGGKGGKGGGRGEKEEEEKGMKREGRGSWEEEVGSVKLDPYDRGIRFDSRKGGGRVGRRGGRKG